MHLFLLILSTRNMTLIQFIHLFFSPINFSFSAVFLDSEWDFLLQICFTLDIFSVKKKDICVGEIHKISFPSNYLQKYAYFVLPVHESSAHMFLVENHSREIEIIFFICLYVKQFEQLYDDKVFFFYREPIPCLSFLEFPNIDL